MKINYGNIVEYDYLSLNLASKDVILFYDEVGKKLLLQSRFKNSFFKLAPHFAPQQHITTCGIATVAMILNAIYTSKCIKRPLDGDSCIVLNDKNQLFGNFIWNENTLLKSSEKFNITTENSIKGINHSSIGLTLEQLVQIIKSHGVDAQCVYVDEISKLKANNFREIVKNYTMSSNKFIIANYNINFLFSMLDVGHFSPIVAYEANEDYVLILDTWAAHTPWIWVKLECIYKNMNTLDKDNNMYRGYILVG